MDIAAGLRPVSETAFPAEPEQESSSNHALSRGGRCRRSRIAIHEWGHLLAAKWCGIPVERFSLGFGPKLAGFRYRGTSYWLSAIPLGGYVLPALDESESRRLPLRKAILFALGGPFANVVSAYLCLIVVGRLELSRSAIGTLSFAATRLWLDVHATIHDLERIGLDVLS